jgi:hypothetical protein
VVLGNAQDLAQGRRLLGPGCAEPEVVEDPADRKLLSDEGENAHALATAGAEERVHLVDLRPRKGFIFER